MTLPIDAIGYSNPKIFLFFFVGLHFFSFSTFYRFFDMD